MAGAEGLEPTTVGFGDRKTKLHLIHRKNLRSASNPFAAKFYTGSKFANRNDLQKTHSIIHRKLNFFHATQVPSGYRNSLICILCFQQAFKYLFLLIFLERVAGIEPAYSAWKAAALPLCYTRPKIDLGVFDIAITPACKAGARYFGRLNHCRPMSNLCMSKTSRSMPVAHTPHEIHDDFPEYAEKIHDLKVNDSHFARLAEEYHEINRKIHRLETRVEASSESREEDLRKKRMHLKDQLAAMLFKP